MKHDKAKSFFYITAAICLLVFYLVYAYKAYCDNRYICVTKNDDSNVVIRVFDTYTEKMEIYHHYYDDSKEMWRYIHFAQEPEE